MGTARVGWQAFISQAHGALFDLQRVAQRGVGLELPDEPLRAAREPALARVRDKFALPHAQDATFRIANDRTLTAMRAADTMHQDASNESA